MDPHREEIYRIVGAIERAKRELAVPGSEEARDAMNDLFACFGALYAQLDFGDHAVASSHLSSLYDRCLLCIGEARPGHAESLDEALALLRGLVRASVAA